MDFNDLLFFLIQHFCLSKLKKFIVFVDILVLKTFKAKFRLTCTIKYFQTHKLLQSGVGCGKRIYFLSTEFKIENPLEVEEICEISHDLSFLLHVNLFLSSRL